MILKIQSVFALVLIMLVVSCHSGEKNKNTTPEKTIVKENSEENNQNKKSLSRTFLASPDLFDASKKNVRLVLQYKPAEKGFKGYMENTTNETIKKVSVVIYIEGKAQIGPLSPTDLYPNEKMELTFTYDLKEDEKWLPDLLFGE